MKNIFFPESVFGRLLKLFFGLLVFLQVSSYVFVLSIPEVRSELLNFEDLKREFHSLIVFWYQSFSVFTIRGSIISILDPETIAKNVSIFSFLFVTALTLFSLTLVVKGLRYRLSAPLFSSRIIFFSFFIYLLNHFVVLLASIAVVIFGFDLEAPDSAFLSIYNGERLSTFFSYDYLGRVFIHMLLLPFISFSLIFTFSKKYFFNFRKTVLITFLMFVLWIVLSILSSLFIMWVIHSGAAPMAQVADWVTSLSDEQKANLDKGKFQFLHIFINYISLPVTLALIWLSFIFTQLAPGIAVEFLSQDKAERA